jgi:hypothetical protein
VFISSKWLPEGKWDSKINSKNHTYKSSLCFKFDFRHSETQENVFEEFGSKVHNTFLCIRENPVKVWNLL